MDLSDYDAVQIHLLLGVFVFAGILTAGYFAITVKFFIDYVNSEMGGFRGLIRAVSLAICLGLLFAGSGLLFQTVLMMLFAPETPNPSSTLARHPTLTFEEFVIAVVILIISAGLYWLLKHWKVDRHPPTEDALSRKRTAVGRWAGNWLMATGLCWPLIIATAAISGYDWQSWPAILTALAVGAPWASGFHLWHANREGKAGA